MSDTIEERRIALLASMAATIHAAKVGASWNDVSNTIHVVSTSGCGCLNEAKVLLRQTEKASR